jgi:hypothetical protein
MTNKNSKTVPSNDEVTAVATGVPQQKKAPRKNRVVKTKGVGGVSVTVKKKKEPKPPRNPFRRSQTVKLQLKNIQMGKRVETMTPRVETLRVRLDVMQKRLDFMNGKLRLVKEELSVRATCTDGDTNVEKETMVDTVDHGVVDTIDQECKAGSAEDSDEDIELDDEVEDGMNVLETPACV